MPRLELVEDLTQAPIPPGTNIIVEFDPASQWYNASLTIAAGWLRTGGSVSYIAQSQPPEDVRSQLRQLGLAVDDLEQKLTMRSFSPVKLHLRHMDGRLLQFSGKARSSSRH